MIFWAKFSVLLAVVLATVLFIAKRREKLRAFFGEVQFEMSKVSWPNSDEVINSTILIFIVTIALALQCLVTDSIFASILREFYR